MNYVCLICYSDHSCWDDAAQCFLRCSVRANADTEASRNVKPPELLCECAAADLDRRGLRFVFAKRNGFHPRLDSSGYWMLVHWPTASKREFYLHPYCPFCGRKPRMFRNAEREPKPQLVNPQV